jgi:hypothetical protein
MLVSPVGLRSEKGCAGVTRQKLKITDPTSRQRGRPILRNPQLSKIIKEKRGKIGRGSQMSASHQDGRNLTLTLTLT